MEIRVLREGDERSEFQSGDPDLDRYFHKFAGQNQFRHYLGVTYVAVERHTVVGYTTVAAGSVEIESIPNAMRKKFPKYPIPVLRLARLAVDQHAHKQGLGRQLLRFVLSLSVRMADEYGCAGVLVDAKSTAVEFYAKHGFAELEVLEGASDARPSPVLMYLPMRAIRAALGKRH